MNAQQQNPDGSWSDMQPTGWQGSAMDFEVYGNDDDGWKANGYDEDVLLEVVTARTRRSLARKMRKAAKRHAMSHTEF